jgi:hypothetical protein
MIRVSARVRAFPNGCQRRAGMARSILGAWPSPGPEHHTSSKPSSRPSPSPSFGVDHGASRLGPEAPSHMRTASLWTPGQREGCNPNPNLGPGSVARYFVPRLRPQNAGRSRCVLALTPTLTPHPHPPPASLTLTPYSPLTLTQAPDGGHAVWMCSTDKPK